MPIPKWEEAMRTLIIAAVATFLMGQSDKTPLDYGQLDQRVSVASVRAGNHDPSGQNTYYFTVTPYAFVNDPSDRQKPMADRRHVTGVSQRLGDVHVAALGRWQGEKPLEALLAGDEMRRLTAEAMRTFAVAEDKVALYVIVRLFAKAKRFYVFGEDLLVAENGYFVLGESLPRRINRKGVELLLSDALGTYVPFQVVYIDANKTTTAH